MTIEALAAQINEATGYTGADLETATFFASMIFADAVGNKQAGDYFQGRMRQSFAKTQAAQ